jgi:hypothetical protein
MGASKLTEAEISKLNHSLTVRHCFPNCVSPENITVSWKTNLTHIWNMEKTITDDNSLLNEKNWIDIDMGGAKFSYLF